MSWVYTVKLNPDRSLARVKEQLVGNTYSIDYKDSFSLVAKMTLIALITLATTLHQSLYQLDLMNAFPRGISYGVTTCGVQIESFYG